MHSLKVGHYTDTHHATGVTVFLFDHPAKASYLLCGAAPATREMHTLELEGIVGHIDGLVFTGGSAFGLGVADGVMRWFKECDRGFPAPKARVPVVPTAAIYDLWVKSSVAPTADNAYMACQNAVKNNFLEGAMGAGTGATVGKLIPHAKPMSSGIGVALLELPNGVKVLAYALVNSVGDVRNDKNKIIAGATDKKGHFADCEQFLLTGHHETIIFPSNTTLVAIFTNADFSKTELKRITKMATAGLARAVAPVFTPYDGDLIVAVSLGKKTASEMTVGCMAVEATRQAIVNAVKKSTVMEYEL